jgi:hypothetical protein
VLGGDATLATQIDGPEIARVYQTEVDKQNRVAHGQQRLTVTA